MTETRISEVARLAVVGTAGHIDHGKTAMVRRLTGVDTDRLPEEKKRGISIDLGFAPLVTPAGVRVGIVDVPGHERFVKNMLSGVGGIDLVLLVIAADEGVMPQTREHLAIVKLLGIARGIVVLTKRDLVDQDWIDLVTRDVRALLATTPFASAPIMPFSATTGEGQLELLAELDRQLAALPARSSNDATRLPIDRVFTMEGFGTVVTGTLWRGRVRTGDTLALEPGGREVRVRRVQVHGATVDEAVAGQRTAVAIHGVDRQEVTRGDWLATPGSLQGSTTLDVRFELLDDVPRVWPRIARVRFHLGASEIIGRLTLLGSNTLESGKSALAQLRLERPAVAARGDRFVIRTYSPSRTVGGGSVIEPVATRRRRQAAGLEQLAVFESGSIEARLLQRLGAEPKMTSTAEIARRLSEPEPAVSAALRTLSDSGRVVEPVGGRWLAADRWGVVREAIEREVRAYAERYPARYGISKGDLKSGLKTSIEAGLFDAAFDALSRDGRLELRAERVRPAGAPWEPPAPTLAALEKLEAELNGAGLSVPDNPTWTAKIGAAAAEAAALGFFLGRLVRVSQDYTYSSTQMEALKSKLAAFLARKPVLTVADFKELAGVSRKWAVPLLEHTDRVGWTARSGDERKAGARLM